jgi:hypothetical protein
MKMLVLCVGMATPAVAEKVPIPQGATLGYSGTYMPSAETNLRFWQTYYIEIVGDKVYFWYYVFRTEGGLLLKITRRERWGDYEEVLYVRPGYEGL